MWLRYLNSYLFILISIFFSLMHNSKLIQTLIKRVAEKERSMARYIAANNLIGLDIARLAHKRYKRALITELLNNA